MSQSFAFIQMKSQKELDFSGSFSGGLNVSLKKNKIADNECASALNFYKVGDRVLLRPGIAKKFTQQFGKVIDVYPKTEKDVLIMSVICSDGTTVEKHGIYVATETGIFYYDGENAVLVKRIIKSSTTETVSADSLNLSEGAFVSSGKTAESSFIANDKTYNISGESVLFVGCGYFFNIAPERNAEDSTSTDAALYLRDVEPYIPTVMSECTAAGEGGATESHNILTGKCRQMFTTDSTSLTYCLCEPILEAQTVTLDYTGAGGVEYQLLFTSLDEGKITSDIKVTLDREYGLLQFSAPLIEAKSENFKNNLVVTYYRESPYLESLKNCSSACWFNGEESESSASGRLFLSKSSSNKNRIYCSSLNDPTYFPEDGILNIGLSNEQITAIMPQSNSVAVFKENSIHMIDYSGSSTENLRFIEVNSLLGCSFSKTIKRVKNFLVFLTRKGVYALNLASLHDERAAVLISKKINPLLQNYSESKLETASAAADGKNYYLFIGNRVFVANYENIDLSNSKRDDSVSWFLWELPFTLSNAFESIYGLCAFSEDSSALCCFDNETKSDCGAVFEASLISKSNDFCYNANLKRILKATFALSGDERAAALLYINLDGEEFSKTVTLGSDTDFEETFDFDLPFNLCKIASFGIKRLADCNKEIFLGDFSASALLGAPKV